MAVEFQSHWRLNWVNHNQSGFATSAANPGDVVAAVITFWVNSGSPAAITPPAGWELQRTVDPIGSGGRYVSRVYWKRVTASEPSAWVFTHPTVLRAAWAVRASGVVSTGNPWRDFDDATGTAANSPELSVDVEAGDGLIIGASQDVDNTTPFGAPEGFTPFWWTNWDYYAARSDAPADSGNGLQITGTTSPNTWVAFLGSLRAEPESEEHSGSGLPAGLALSPGQGAGAPSFAAEGVGSSVVLAPGLGSGTSEQTENHSGSGLPVQLALAPGAGAGTVALAGSGLPVQLALAPGVGDGAVAFAGDGTSTAVLLTPATGSGLPGPGGDGIGAVIVLRPGTGAGFTGSYAYRSNRELVASPDSWELIAVPDERSLVAIPFTRTLTPLED